MNIIKLDQVVGNLKNSVLFNLSLSSKELFHSNFLAWICEQFPKEFGPILIKHLKINLSLSDSEIINVHREKQNMDLIIEFNTCKVIIENKVKSLPNKEQLIKYKIKQGDQAIFVLLSLINPPFSLKEIGWELVTYKQYCYIIKNFKAMLRPDLSYQISVLNDYLYFIQNLVNLTETIQYNMEEDYFDFYGVHFDLFYSIRLHDLYTKHVYSQLQNEIIKYLKKKDNDLNLIISDRDSKDLSNNKLVITTGYSRGKGVIVIQYSKKNDLVFGIMIDGDRYTHFLDAQGKWANQKKEIGNNLRKNNKWFTFDFIPDNESYPRKGKDFNRFENWITRNIKISPSTKILELLDLIFSDVKKLITLNIN